MTSKSNLLADSLRQRVELLELQFDRVKTHTFGECVASAGEV